MQPTNVISARDLSVGYRNRPVVEGLSFVMPPGCLIALVGKNGVGKSTLLRTLTTDLRPIAGDIELMNRPLASYRPREIATHIAVVTTEPLQVGALTVEELVALGRDPHTGFAGRLTADDRWIVAEAMERTGIAYKANEYVARLSDGERQKALIARALAQDTPLIVLDEPFSFLDVSARIDILRTLAALCHKAGKSILFSSHDIAQALRMADMVWMLTPDRRLITGRPEQLVATKAIDGLFDTPGVLFDPAQNDFIASNID